MRFFLSLMIIFTTNCFAEVSRDEARVIIDDMVSKQMISAEEAEKAKSRLVDMSATEWSLLNKDAEDKASRMPASEDSAEEVPVDLSEEQFQTIHHDLSVIAPHYISGK